ncbi:daunorubicin resistance protein DrrA family ABC transporter ATP-binding protein [Halobacillus andaensis]|uniref:Daunorubicin resistance protein DrrA family ABC transporter ATP-binding protein n=1 Tax=Halobacillus andaensis TaxID=1176239 RepID=A0A917B7U3_HALAA|nr:ATP-binding cassette domain-containing protein [Halobacillus andaensis]MBP2005097.1 ABC-2 type transport system ATP-binding protein [Halobacillus andaensis]GGF28868.1 daunorubicin resistance protein DrrA family ABC transporter ATP-binding protein [Halobacillus andaensis]
MERSNKTYAVEADQLVKAFGKERAVNGISLKVPKGIIYGFLGPNGAGKTTMIRMLATLLKPTEGQAKVMGYDLTKEADEVRQSISLTGQFASVDEEISGRENLIFIGRLVGFSRKEAKQRADELLAAFNLEDAAKRQVKKYSGGMRRRIDIAASIITSPELLFLDEPTTGLDPRSRNEVWTIIRALVKNGTTVFLTTQYLEEADQLADLIGVIDRGVLIAEGTSAELKSSIGVRSLIIEFEDERDLNKAESIFEGMFAQTPEVDRARLSISVTMKDQSKAAKAIGELANHQIAVKDFSMQQPSLDDVFLTITGKPAKEKGGEANGE